MFYFAYGSNLNMERLYSRCGDVTKVCNYTHEGYKLTFDTGNELYSFANMVPSENDEIDGVIYDINPKQEFNLDIYEGISDGLYRKQYFSYRNIPTLVYIGTNVVPINPTIHYLSIIKTGAEYHNLPKTLKIVTNLLEQKLKRYER